MPQQTEKILRIAKTEEAAVNGLIKDAEGNQV
jgi:hypothetical protein